jgi:hypothetical protein
MKLITFLGITDYEEVEYRWHDLSNQTKFVQEASCPLAQARNDLRAAYKGSAGKNTGMT